MKVGLCTWAAAPEPLPSAMEGAPRCLAPPAHAAACGAPSPFSSSSALAAAGGQHPSGWEISQRCAPGDTTSYSAPEAGMHFAWTPSLVGYDAAEKSATEKATRCH